jgi:glycosyltransferase involved in cell wall biosynthesis
VDVFTRDTLPLIRREVPGAELIVVGRADAGGARAIARRPGVRLLGALESLDDVVASSRMLVVPLRAGSGTRVKILDAFARGLPVVSTTVGHEGLDVTPGVELSDADRPADFAAAVVGLLRDDALAERQRQAGLEHVRARHDLPVVAPRLLRAVDALRR